MRMIVLASVLIPAFGAFTWVRMGARHARLSTSVRVTEELAERRSPTAEVFAQAGVPIPEPLRGPTGVPAAPTGPPTADTGAPLGPAPNAEAVPTADAVPTVDLAELLAGITMPCDLLPRGMQHHGPYGCVSARFSTDGYRRPELAPALSDAVAAIGGELVWQDDRIGRIHRNGDEATVTVESDETSGRLTVQIESAQVVGGNKRSPSSANC